jgi:Trk K+ transport system NAD-binding subunit
MISRPEVGSVVSGRGTRIRLAGLVLVALLAIAAFAGGVTTSGVPEMGSESPLAWVYYAAGLFVFGGLDLGSPVGGPAGLRAALWLAYFLAPAITTTAVIEAALRLQRPDWARRRSLRDHLILVGAGRVGLAYLQAVRAVEPHRPVLLVDRGRADVPRGEAERMGNVEWIEADVRRPATLDALGIDGADRMVVVTDDDLVNLEASWAAQERRGDLPIAVHVADLTLLRPVNRLTREMSRGSGELERFPLVFNTHRIGALHLYERYLHPHFQETGYKDVLVLAGFGRFAQTILELLRVTAADELARVVVVAGEAERRVRQFAADVPLDALDLVTVEGEPDDPGTWERVERALEGVEGTPVYLLAGSSEVTNFRAAMLLRSRFSAPRIFARCFHRTLFAESLADQVSFELLAFEEVLREALVEHYESLRTL